MSPILPHFWGVLTTILLLVYFLHLPMSLFPSFPSRYGHQDLPHSVHLAGELIVENSLSLHVTQSFLNTLRMKHVAFWKFLWFFFSQIHFMENFWWIKFFSSLGWERLYAQLTLLSGKALPFILQACHLNNPDLSELTTQK
jgi:hypothetical protein